MALKETAFFCFGRGTGLEAIIMGSGESSWCLTEDFYCHVRACMWYSQKEVQIGPDLASSDKSMPERD